MNRSTDKRISFSAAATFALAVLIITTHTAAAQTNTFPSSGNAGVGTTTPANPLTVVGNIVMEANASANSGVGVLGVNSNSALLQLYDSSRTMRVYLSSQSGINSYLTNGNFGIGTTNPANARLQVNKSIRIDDDSGSATGSDTVAASPFLYLGTTTGGGLFQFNGAGGIDLWQYNGSFGRTVTFAKTGNVGIGTATPAAILDISSAQPDIALNHTNTANYSRLLFKDNGADRAAFQYIGSTFGTTARRNAMEFYNNYGPVIFYTDGAGNGLARVWIDTSGNVGIGASPNSLYKLDVAGNINSSATITGNSINAKYQDVAEWVPASEQLSAGTVVVLDSTKSNQVISSSQSYDTRVAGVISAQPGITLGEGGAGKVLVATTGRVRVKVDATRAPIHIGDLLVTSDVTGLAMKSEAVNLGGVQIHRPGTLIGKALEPLEKGSGTILVLLSLQ